MAGDTVGRDGLVPLDGRLVYVSDRPPDVPDAELEFRQLRYFVSVAEELHFGRAAARMYITQPALSQAIAGLERALDVKLFARTRRNVELTDAGVELLRHARGMLADREEAVAGVRRVGRGEAGVLRLGIALLAEQEVAPALASLAFQSPGLVVDRSAAVTERLLASVQDRALDAAVVHRLPVLATLEGIESEVIRRGTLAALVGSTSPLAQRHSLPLSDLGGETFLVAPREFAPRAFEAFKTMCRTHGGFDATVLELSASTVPLGADWQPIVDGDAVALMPEATARAAEQNGETVAIPIVAPPEFELAVAWRRGNDSSILQRFLTFLRTYRERHAWSRQA